MDERVPVHIEVQGRWGRELQSAQALHTPGQLAPTRLGRTEFSMHVVLILESGIAMGSALHTRISNTQEAGASYNGALPSYIEK